MNIISQKNPYLQHSETGQVVILAEVPLTNINGLAMKEVLGEFTRTPVEITCFWGSKLIDGIWATADIMVCNASIMLAGYSIGDHLLFVINFASSNILLGIRPQRSSVLCPND